MWPLPFSILAHQPLLAGIITQTDAVASPATNSTSSHAARERSSSSAIPREVLGVLQNYHRQDRRGEGKVPRRKSDCDLGASLQVALNQVFVPLTIDAVLPYFREKEYLSGRNKPSAVRVLCSSKNEARLCVAKIVRLPQERPRQVAGAAKQRAEAMELSSPSTFCVFARRLLTECHILMRFHTRKRQQLTGVSVSEQRMPLWPLYETIDGEGMECSEDGADACPAIVFCPMAFRNRCEFIFLLDLLPYGNLADHVFAAFSASRNRPPPALDSAEARQPTVRALQLTTAIRYVAEVIVGLRALHKKGIIMRDLKLSNLCLDAQGHVVLIDFDQSAVLKTGEGTMLKDGPVPAFGTTGYRAPELFDDKVTAYGSEIDYWSLGVCFYFMIEANYPKMEDQHVSDDDPWIKFRCGIWSAPAKAFVKALLRVDGTTRLNDDNVCLHPVFRGVVDDWSTLYDTVAPTHRKDLGVQAFDCTTDGEEGATPAPLRGHDRSSGPHAIMPGVSANQEDDDPENLFEGY